MPQVNQTTLNIASTTVYASAQKAKILALPKCSIVIHNPHETNSIKSKVLVSNDVTGDPNSFAVDKEETTIAAGSSSTHVLTGCFAWVDVQIVDASSGNHGLANVYLQATGI